MLVVRWRLLFHQVTLKRRCPDASVLQLRGGPGRRSEMPLRQLADEGPEAVDLPLGLFGLLLPVGQATQTLQELGVPRDRLRR